MRYFSLLLLMFLTPWAAFAGPVALERAHSHNDYTRAVPLQTALDHGFCSVEADIHLVEGALLVAHDLDKVEASKTLEALYLAPLKKHMDANNGWVYTEGISLTLLIDFKSHADDTYTALKPLLEKYRDMLTVFTDEKTTPGAVTVILSGNRPFRTVSKEAERLVGIDGRLNNLSNSNPNLLPLISHSWAAAFTWKGTGTFPEEERAKLEDYVKQAHANGQRLRFWALPRPGTTWPLLYEAGVDLLNADNLDALQAFLLKQKASKE